MGEVGQIGLGSASLNNFSGLQGVGTAPGWLVPLEGLGSGVM